MTEQEKYDTKHILAKGMRTALTNMYPIYIGDMTIREWNALCILSIRELDDTLVQDRYAMLDMDGRDETIQ